MAQLTIYLDEDTVKRVENAARKEGVSLSRWAREKLSAASELTSWPSGYASLLGSLRDESFTVPEELPAGGDHEVEL